MGLTPSKGLLLVDKPKGISSFDVIRILRKKLGIRKMGHAGTLDPLATGLLIIGMNEATKKLNTLLGLPKVYEAQVLLGRRTTTGDMEGEVVERYVVDVGGPQDELTLDRIRLVLQSMVGKLTLLAPAYSAIKVQGMPLYKMARRGTNIVTPPMRDMEVYWLTLKDHWRDKETDGYILSIELEVKSGTYIRSIAEEIGRRLQVPATIKELRRTRIGDYSIEDAERVIANDLSREQLQSQEKEQSQEGQGF